MKQISDELYSNVRKLSNKYALLISGISQELEFMNEEGEISPEQYEVLSEKFEASVMHEVYKLTRTIIEDVKRIEGRE